MITLIKAASLRLFLYLKAAFLKMDAKKRDTQTMLREGEAVSYRAEVAAAQAHGLQNVLLEVEKQKACPEVQALRNKLSDAQKTLATHLKYLDVELLKLHKLNS